MKYILALLLIISSSLLSMNKENIVNNFQKKMVHDSNYYEYPGGSPLSPPLSKTEDEKKAIYQNLIPSHHSLVPSQLTKSMVGYFCIDSEKK